MFKKSLKDTFGHEVQSFESNSKKVKESLGNVLHLIERSKIQEAFGRIAAKKGQVDSAAKSAFSVLNKLESRQLKQCFAVMRLNASIKNDATVYLMSQVSKTFNSCVK